MLDHIVGPDLAARDHHDGDDGVRHIVLVGLLVDSIVRLPPPPFTCQPGIEEPRRSNVILEERAVARLLVHRDLHRVLDATEHHTSRKRRTCYECPRILALVARCFGRECWHHQFFGLFC